MLNIEYYKDRLEELGIINLDELAVIQGQPRICDVDTKCTECLFIHSFSCPDEALNWLLTEYKEEPKVDWSKVKVDTPILVKDKKAGKWRKRYFAGFKYGKVCAWLGGATSWTANSNMNSWKYAKLAEREE